MIGRALGAPAARRARVLLLAAAAACVLGGCGNRGEYVEYEHEIGYKGAAHLNPFLAAGRLLESFEWVTDRTSSVTQLPDEFTTMVVPARSVPSFGSAARFREWVEYGGHLIYIVDNTEPKPRYLGDVFELLSGDEQEHPVLEEFGLELVERDADGLAEVDISSPGLEIEMDADRLVRTGAGWSLSYQQPDVVLGDTDEGARLLSSEFRHGRITVVADGGPFRNRHIGEHDHARVFVELIELHPYYEVTFVYGSGSSFFRLLMHFAWMPLLGLAVLTALWIWKNLPRFGPVVPHRDGGSRQFTEHLDVTGRFLWRHKASAALLAPLCGRLVRAFVKRNPHLAGEGDAHIEYFASASGLSPQEVREALGATAVTDPATMTRIVRNLQRIDQAL